MFFGRRTSGQKALKGVIFLLPFDSFPDIITAYRSNTGGYEKESERGGFKEVPEIEAEKGDVIAFFRHGVIFHVAVYLGRGEMLHTGLNRHCRVEKIRTMQFVESRFYRYSRTELK